jgi:hypothetical protein
MAGEAWQDKARQGAARHGTAWGGGRVKTARVPLASMVEDFSLYPRATVNDTHVRELRRSLQAGDQLPPIILEAGTLRIVDGFHRRRALIANLGPEGVVKAELREYPDELSLYQDAAALNATHGQPLDRDDQVRVAVHMRELGANDEIISATLHTPLARVVELVAKFTAFSQSGETVVLKPAARHLAQETLTLEQEAVQPHITGTATLRLVSDLRARLRASIVDLENPKVRQKLNELVEEVTRALEPFAVAS